MVVAFCVSSYWKPWPKIEGSNDWIGFWGSYLGAIIGGAITLIVLWKTIVSNRQEREQQEKLEFFHKIINEATYLDMYPKKIISSLVKGNKGQYFSDLLEYNRKVLELQLILEIEDERNKYEDIGSLIKKIKDNLDVTETLLKHRDFEDEKETQKFLEEQQLAERTSNAILFEVKKFVIKNKKG